jgi:hypothetical protein
VNRRSFLAGLAAGIAALAVTTRLAISELRLVEVWDLEGDYAQLFIAGTDQLGRRIHDTVIITAQQLEDSNGSITLPRFKEIDTVICENSRELRRPGYYVCAVHGLDPESMNHPERWSS